uniref:Uncharacterized protein n=1 Tax=Romanomermis culicivorax TaxID=13658 RepID=A0A915IGE5_ROMCU
MKLLRLGRIPQNFAGFHYQAHAYIAMKLQPEFNTRQEGVGSNFHAMYSSCQARAAGLVYTVAKAVLQDKKDPEPKYVNIQHTYNRPAASKVSKRWTRKDSDVRKREKSATPDKDRKRKHESRQRDESCHEKSMSREKKRRENEEESW